MRYITPFIFIIMISSQSFSQPSLQNLNDRIEPENKEEESKNSLKKGRWAIQFGIGSNFSLENFEGAAISLKRQFSKHFGLRLSVLGNFQNITEDTGNVESQNKSLGTNLCAIYYLNPKDKFNVYGYLGFRYNYSYLYHYTDENYYYETKTWETGPLLGAGAEYFIYKKFSVFAEYSYKFAFGKRYESYSNNNLVDNREFNTVNISSDQLKFGLSVYF